jgi:predicted dehydrogenase
MNSKGLKLLYTTCKKKKINIFVGYNIIFLDSLIKLKDILRKEKILKVSIKTNYDLRLWRKNKNYKKSVSAIKNKGGGVLLELSHDIHYLMWLIGLPKWVSCYYSKLSDLKVNTEDNVILNIGFNKIISNLQMDFINKYNQRNLEVLTKKNYYQWDYNNNTIKKYNPKTKKLYLFFKGKIDKNLSYKEELKDFFKQNNQSKILKNLNLAISTLILIDEAKKSKINNMKRTLLNFKNV